MRQEEWADTAVRAVAEVLGRTLTDRPTALLVPPDKEIVMLGGCVESMVPPYVADAMKAKLEGPASQGDENVRLVSLRD